MKTKIFVAVLVGVLVVSVVASGMIIPANQKAKVIPNAYIVQVADTADVDQIAEAVAGFSGGGIGHVYSKALRGFSIQVPPGITKAQIVAQAGVILVEPDLEVRICQQVLPTGVDRIDVDLNDTAKIDGTDERVDVDIAVIDTGIDGDHPDLNVVGGRRFYTIATGPPWQRGSFEDDNYEDDNGHGSHVAGTAAAIDNDIGVVGVAPGARLWAVKVLDAGGSGYLSDVIAGVEWVTDNAGTIEVANMSLSWQGNNSSARTAIQNSVAAGVVYVVAAGNDSADVYGPDGKFGTNDDIEPASYPEAATISAMADADGQPGGQGGSTSYGSDDAFATFSNFSHGVVDGNPVVSPGAAIDLLLPGVDIYSAYKNGGYATGSGTSMASPHAAGLVALYIAANGRATDADGVYVIRQALINGGVAQDSAQGLAILTDPDENWENIGWAGTEPTGPQPPTANAGPDQTLNDADDDGSETVTLDASGSSDADGTIESYEWDIDADGVTDMLGMTVDTVFAVGSHTVTLTVTDNDGLTDTDEVIITVTEAGGATAMHVAGIDMSLSTKTAGRNIFWKAAATVTIWDASVGPVEGATVYGSWSDATSDVDSGVTDSSGKVTLSSDGVKNASSGTTFTFTVDDVVKSGWTYEPVNNVEDSNSISVQ